MTTKIKLKARPVVTLADFARSAGPLMPSTPVHVNYLSAGQPHFAKIKGRILAGVYVAMICPACGQPTENLYPGLRCDVCLHGEPLAGSENDGEIVDVRPG